MTHRGLQLIINYKSGYLVPTSHVPRPTPLSHRRIFAGLVGAGALLR